MYLKFSTYKPTTLRNTATFLSTYLFPQLVNNEKLSEAYLFTNSFSKSKKNKFPKKDI